MGMSHLTYAFTNFTTLEDMSYSHELRSKAIIRGAYNFGVAYNLKVVGFLSWSWWLPLAHKDKYEGYIWPEIKVPKEYLPVNLQKKIHCYKHGKMAELDSMEEVYLAAQIAYQGYRFTYAD